MSSPSSEHSSSSATSDDERRTCLVPEVRIDAETPRVVADLGEELYLVKFPNFVSVETRPYDPASYEDEIDEDEVRDEGGRGRLKLRVENTIRWKKFTNPLSGEERIESNAKIARWSDDSMSLHLGPEIFDIHECNLKQGENNHLFVRQLTGLYGQAIFKTKLSFRPHSTDSFTHRKMTLSLADKSRKTHKICVLSTVGEDPEARRTEMIKKEENRLRASIRRKNKIPRTRHQREPSASYLEGESDDEDEDGAISLSAIKNSYKNRDYGATYSDDSRSSDTDKRKTSSAARVEPVKRAAIVDSDDDE